MPSRRKTETGRGAGTSGTTSPLVGVIMGSKSPVTLFVAGLYAVYKRNTGQPSPAAVAVYNNKPGDWTTVKLAAPPMGPSNPMFASAAYMRVYEDTVTKRQYLLVFPAVPPSALPSAAAGASRHWDRRTGRG